MCATLNVYIFEMETRGCSGATENAGLENAGPSKMQGWKTRDWKTRDHMTGMENARPTVMERRRYK